MNSILPVGSVVLLRQGPGRVMIIGRCQKDKSTGELFDYIACPFPEGLMNNKNVICFNKEDIAMTFSLGYQNEEELLLRKELKKAWEVRK